VVVAPFVWVGAVWVGAVWVEVGDTVVDDVEADCVVVQPPRINSRETAAAVTAVVPLVKRTVARLRLRTSAGPVPGIVH
jgi:hypothetical protein